MGANISHKSLSAAVKAAALFSAKGRCPRPAWKAVNVAAGAGALAVESGCGDHSARITIPAPYSVGIVEVQLDEDAARAVSRYDWNSLTLYTNDETGARSVSIGGANMPADGDTAELCRLDTPTGETRTATVPWRAWVAAESAIVPATDGESFRYAFGSVLLQTIDGRGFFVGTDGRRLHTLSAPVSGNPGESLIRAPLFGLIRKAVEAVARSTTGTTGRKLAGYLADTFLTVTTNGAAMVVSWSDGGAVVSVMTTETNSRFPRWRDVSPNRPEEVRCTFNGETLRREVVAAAVVTTEQTKGVTFGCIHGTAATLTAGGGLSTFAGPLSGDVPESIQVKLDPKFVVDMIDAAADSLPGAPIVFGTTDHQSAVTIEVGAGFDAAGDEYGFNAVIMPLAIECV
jgi:DNA polymerase-3 subunit beta